MESRAGCFVVAGLTPWNKHDMLVLQEVTHSYFSSHQPSWENHEAALCPDCTPGFVDHDLALGWLDQTDRSRRRGAADAQAAHDFHRRIRGHHARREGFSGIVCHGKRKRAGV